MRRPSTRSLRYIDGLKKDKKNVTIIAGGKYDKSVGYFIEPTVAVTKDPKSTTMCEEIFGPVLTIYVYFEPLEETLKLVDATSDYALTGAVFSQDRASIVQATRCAAPRGRQLLHQRQADGRGGGPATLRRRARQRHQRQGRQLPEPHPLGERTHHQGDLRARRRTTGIRSWADPEADRRRRSVFVACPRGAIGLHLCTF